MKTTLVALAAIFIVIVAGIAISRALPSGPDLELSRAGPYYTLPEPVVGAVRGHDDIHSEVQVFRCVNVDSKETQFIIITRGFLHAVDISDPRRLLLNDLEMDLSPLVNTKAVFVVNEKGSLVRTAMTLDAMEDAVARHTFQEGFVSATWKTEIEPKLVSLTQKQ